MQWALAFATARVSGKKYEFLEVPLLLIWQSSCGSITDRYNKKAGTNKTPCLTSRISLLITHLSIAENSSL